jgi:hypothetical protein
MRPNEVMGEDIIYNTKGVFMLPRILSKMPTKPISVTLIFWTIWVGDLW